MEKYECPLCKSSLEKEKYLKIVGVWAAREKEEKKLREERESVKLEKANLEKEKKQITKQIEEKIKQKYLVEKEKDRAKLIKEVEKKANKEAQKAANKIAEIKMNKFQAKIDYLTGLLTKKTTEIGDKNNRIRELSEQLKKKRTPQDEGILNEFKIIEILKGIFKGDKIIHYGQGGDILQEIIQDGKRIAAILYECKKTQKFDKDWINKLKEDMKKRDAEIGVIVTYAFGKNSCGYERKENIHIVHPYAIHHIAEMLRNIEIVKHNSKLSEKDRNEKIRKIYEYAKSTEFSSGIAEIILTIRNDVALLNQEKKIHDKIWKQREIHHTKLAEKVTKIKKKTIGILGGEEEKEEDEEEKEAIVVEAYTG